MRIKKSIGFILSFVLVGSQTKLFAAVTLKQCYVWAQNLNEDLKIRQEDVYQSSTRGKAALASALPDLSWNLTDTWQDPKGVDELARRGFAGFVEKEQVESKFSLRQPLFSGFREFTAYSGFKHENERNKFQFQRSSLELFERIANAFYAVIDSETNQENTRSAWTLAEDRVKELKGFLRLGKSRDSELFTAEGRSAALKAHMDQIDAQIAAAREELSYLTGQDLSNAPLQDEISSTPQIGTLEQTLARAKGERTDLRAQRAEVELRKLRIRYERGYHWPMADVTGNYYTRRAAYLDAIDWDVILSLKVPFFQGGAVNARVNEAMSIHRQATLRLEEMERRVLYTVRRTYKDLEAALREAQSLDIAAEAGQKSYDALRKEYKYGLVTNLDVLEALDFLQVQKSARDSARLKVKRLYIQLQVALEQTPI